MFLFPKVSIEQICIQVVSLTTVTIFLIRSIEAVHKVVTSFLTWYALPEHPTFELPFQAVCEAVYLITFVVTVKLHVTERVEGDALSAKTGVLCAFVTGGNVCGKHQGGIVIEML